jgi:uncharacterized repeat protein (TIGR01451 family)
MRTGLNHIRTVFSAVAALATLSAGTELRAQTTTISNTATVQWQAGSATVVRNSNRVDIAVGSVVTPTLTLSTFQFSGDPNAERLTVPETICRGTGGEIPVTLTGAFASTPLDPASVERTTRIRAGEPLVVGITSSADNRDATAVDTMTVVLATPAGDAETVVLRETGANTGYFVGMIRTVAVPPDSVRGDCQLSVRPGDTLTLSTSRENGSLVASSPVEVLIDPFGVAFDSGDGAPVQGVQVTLINADTGQPAIVFGDDAVSRFPSTLLTGSTVTDASGLVYRFPVGDYRFPFVAPGRYRLVVGPPSPYTAPSLSTPAELANLRRLDGEPYTIVAGSYGGVFVLNDPQPVRIDIPLDRPGAALTIRKSASQAVVVPGDGVQYKVIVTNGDAARATGAITITDFLPDTMRLSPHSVRYNGIKAAYTISSDGKRLSVPVAPLPARASGTLTYLLEVRPDAPSGQTMNRAQATDSRGTTSAVADAMVRIARDGIGDRLTIIGRVTDGGCAVDPNAANGVAGVRVMLEDGSYAVTDIDGRYHFEGVLPGTHVVQIDPSTLGPNLVPSDCAENARSAGSAISRFVTGQGGVLLRADFRAKSGLNAALPQGKAAARAKPVSDPEAAGANRDWVSGEAPGVGWIFPAPDHNPRTKAIRVAIKHLPGQTVALSVDGKPANPLSFDGDRKSGDGQVLVSLWRAIDIGDRDTVLSAVVTNADGSIAERLTRTVHYSPAAMYAEFVREKSTLVADGVTRPVIAIRLTDRDGKPVHHGITGDFSVPAPYAAAVEVDAQAARQLAGLERARPVYQVMGEEGMAYIELEATTASGALTVTLPFRDGQITRAQKIDLWLDPGNRPWTLVGLAEGTIGFNSVERQLQDLPGNSREWLTSGRLALYAKGRILGKWLMTLAYDSAKKGDDARFGGVIDPTSYYTIYADRSERRYDAASVRKLYLKLERPQFYALFGDYQTDLSDTQLTRYNRAFNGVKAQYRSKQVGATAFAADTPYRHRHEELQGNGLSGPYGLGARDILPNSEVIVLETRDRLRSDRVVERKTLTRHIDYDIDYVAGTLRFRSPILSRSSGFDPQFIVIDYEVDGIGQRVLNAGGRATWNTADKKLQVGASVIHDESDTAKTNVGGVDVRYQPNSSTEIRAELAMSRATAKSGTTLPVTGNRTAWLVEAEHHGTKYDLLAYARQQEGGFGVGQLGASENGTRKFGFDGRLRLSEQLSLIGSAWQESYLTTNARRQAGRAGIEYRGKTMDLRAGLILANDRLDNGTEAGSTIAQLGATKRMFDNRLEVDGQAEFALGKSASIDFPAKHRLGARFAITPEVAVVGSYEIARGDSIKADTARIGFDVRPWAGARIVAAANRQTIGEYGPRSFADYGLAQSLPLGKRWTVDFTLDGSKTLGGIDPNRVLNPAQPVATGGLVGTDGTLTEDFTAVTAGATYRGDRWSWTGRGEYRAGDRATRYGVITSALRQLGEGQAIGGTFSWFRAAEKAGTTTETTALALSWAHRPDDSRIAFLEKLELRSDILRNAIQGVPGPIGGAPLLVSGDATSRRIVNSFSLNWSPVAKSEGRYLGRSEIALFWGSRYVFDRVGADDISGWSNLVGLDARWDLSQTLDIGLSGTVRESAGGKAISYSGGPAIGISPFKGGYIQVGYNVLGFHDNDYADARYTRKGPFVTLRFKFDQTTLQGMGLGSRR